MKARYVLVQKSHERISYVRPDFYFPQGNNHDKYPQIVFRSRLLAREQAKHLNGLIVRYPTIYSIQEHEWGYEHLADHPAYREYLKDFKLYKKVLKMISGNDKIQLPSPPPLPFHSSNEKDVGAVSTTDDYNAMALQVTDMSISVKTLNTRMDSLVVAIADNLRSQDLNIERQQGAIVALGNVIKGMDDRLEDLEHPVRSSLTA